MGKENPKAIAELAASMRARVAQAAAAKVTRKKPAADPLHATVNEFAAKQGDFERHNGRVLNRGGTAIDRWRRDGLLSETQQAAIQHMYRLWDLTNSSRAVVANLDRGIAGTAGEGNMAEIIARSDLHRIIDYFPYPMDCYYSIFENCCRFDEPAGVAGSRLAGGDRTGPRAALTVVQFVSDTIYTKERLSY